MYMGEYAMFVKGGTMIATGSIIANTALFNDPTYIYLAIVGAMVSMFGVIHEVFSNNDKTYKIYEIIVEIIKGIILGLVVIPMWYLSITEGVLGKILKLDIGQVSNSLALIISFIASWYTVPIFDWITGFIRNWARKVYNK